MDNSETQATLDTRTTTNHPPPQKKEEQQQQNKTKQLKK
jgi:hypothetical protein